MSIEFKPHHHHYHSHQGQTGHCFSVSQHQILLIHFCKEMGSWNYVMPVRETNVNSLVQDSVMKTLIQEKMPNTEQMGDYILLHAYNRTLYNTEINELLLHENMKKSHRRNRE